jgi:phospholipid-binding lipoprotein MlaA
MLPLMGPTTGRDFMGFVGNAAGDPSNYLPSEFTTSTNLLSIVNTRSGLLDADGFLDSQPDPYVFLRTTYLQNRESAVYDGNPPAPRFEE